LRMTLLVDSTDGCDTTTVLSSMLMQKTSLSNDHYKLML